MAPGFTLGAPSAPLPCPFLHLFAMEVVAPRAALSYPLMIPKGEDALDSTFRSFLFFSCLAHGLAPQSTDFPGFLEIKDSRAPIALTSQPFDILGARSWGHKGPPSSTLARPIWRRGGEPNVSEVWKSFQRAGEEGSGGCRQGRREHYLLTGKVIAPPPRAPSSPPCRAQRSP